MTKAMVSRSSHVSFYCCHRWALASKPTRVRLEQPTGMTDIGLWAATPAFALQINDSGEVVGWSLPGR